MLAWKDYCLGLAASISPGWDMPGYGNYGYGYDGYGHSDVFVSIPYRISHKCGCKARTNDVANPSSWLNCLMGFPIFYVLVDLAAGGGFGAHQTCPPITRHGCPVLLFLVTTSLYQDWVICAPAAFLRCGSRFSGSLSGIKP